MSSKQSIPLHFGRVTAIANDHVRMAPMFGTLRDLGESVRGGAGAGLDELRSQLEKVRSLLTRHFAAEESNSYFGVLMAERPSVCVAVAELCSDHTEMLGTLEDLCKACESGPGDRPHPEIAERLQVFCDRFHAHERREASLMQSFLLDCE